MKLRAPIIFFVLIINLTAFAGYDYLSDPEGNDISNNNIILLTNSKPVNLKFVSDDSSAFYVFWSNGTDTVKIAPDTSSICRIPIDPRIIPPGDYHVEILDQNKIKVLNYHFIVEKSYSYFIIILEILLGLVIFMLGLRFSSKGITRMSGYKLKEILWNLSGSHLKGFLSGIILTLMMQSSTLFSVMIVSFVSDGLISIIGAVYMLAGSAIGTSLIVQVLAFNLSFFSLIMIITGFYLNDKVKKLKYIGMAIMGFGLIFYAIQMMAGVIIPLKNSAAFEHMIILLGSNLPLLFIFISLLTFLVHSSAVTVALTIGLFIAGLIDYRGIIIMVAAANLGTSLTATLAGYRGDSRAKYLTIVNLTARIATCILFIFVMMKLNSHWQSMVSSSHGIANVHLFYNLFFALMIILMNPMINYFSKYLTKGEITPAGDMMIRESIVQNPTMALSKALRDIIKMAELSGKMLERTFVVLKTNDAELFAETMEMDNEIDKYEKQITMFLVSIYEEEASEAVSIKAKNMLFIVDEIEHIGDVISKNILVSAKKRMDNNYYFSEEGFQELKKMYSEVLETYTLTISALTLFDEGLAKKTMKRREEVLSILNQLHNNHLRRLKEGMKESIETSTLHLDLLNDYERINFHLYKICYNITQK